MDWDDCEDLPDLVVSTVDGYLAAYSCGELLWMLAINSSSLVESSKSCEVTHDGKTYNFIASVSGNLYSTDNDLDFEVLPYSSQNLLYDGTLDLDLVISGNLDVESHFIDMSTGKELRNTSSKVHKQENTGNYEQPIIVATRRTMMVEGNEKNSGIERWHYRTSTIDIDLINEPLAGTEPENIKYNVNFVTGEIHYLGEDKCNFKCSTQILNAWELKDSRFVPLNMNVGCNSKNFGFLLAKHKQYKFVRESRELEEFVKNQTTSSKETVKFSLPKQDVNCVASSNKSDCKLYFLNSDLIKVEKLYDREGSSLSDNSYSTGENSIELSSKFQNNYEILERLGSGGFGVVYKAKHKIDKKDFAVKRIEILPGEEEKTLREVELLANLNHKHIIRYYESWKEKHDLNWVKEFDEGWLTVETDDYDETTATESITKTGSKDMVYLYIKMEYCSGGDLSNWIEENKIVKLRYVYSIWFRIIKAVKYIHEKQLIHRDLKPKNIFFHQKQVKVGDFGLAIAKNSNNLYGDNTSSYSISCAGTEYYMSPEQIRREKINSAVDIYALGVIFFEMLKPFETRMERHETLNDLKEMDFPDEFADKYPEEHNKIGEMLSKSPSSRPDIESLFSWALQRKTVLQKKI